jgi:serine/threonine-protein kinase
MGTVHEGENLLINRRVAIKVLNAAAAANETALLRFEREAQAAGRIGSDHILEIIDLGVLPTGERYMVMEYLDGDTLAQRIAQFGRLTPQQLYPLIRQALIGLAAAHQAGIIHRDLKPENLFILRQKAERPDFVKLIDFGISKFGSNGSSLSMTRTGAVMGTPYYMSPEQARGASNLDHRTDLYSMGVILYEALSGRVPFSGDAFTEILYKIVSDQPPELTSLVPGIDQRFASIAQAAMARDPAARPASAAALMKDLDCWAGSVGLEPPRFSSYPPPSSQPASQPGSVVRPSSPPSAPLQSFTPPASSSPPERRTTGNFARSRSEPGRRLGGMAVVSGVALGAVLLVGGAGFIAYALTAGSATSVLGSTADPAASGQAAVLPANQQNPARAQEAGSSTATASDKQLAQPGARPKATSPAAHSGSANTALSVVPVTDGQGEAGEETPQARVGAQQGTRTKAVRPSVSSTRTRNHPIAPRKSKKVSEDNPDFGY